MAYDVRDIPEAAILNEVEKIIQKNPTLPRDLTEMWVRMNATTFLKPEIQHVSPEELVRYIYRGYT